MSQVQLKIDGKSVDTKKRFNDGVWVDIKLNDEPIGLEFLIKSRHSDVGEKVSRTIQRRQQALFQKTGKFSLPDPEDKERQRIDVLAVLITSWRGPAISDDAGVAPQFTEVALRDFLSRETWMLDQLDAVTGDDGRFLRP